MQVVPKRGLVVKVPFGRNIKKGVVLGAAEPLPAAKKVRSLLFNEPVISEREFSIASWLREHYFVTWAEALFSLLPKSFRQKVDFQNREPNKVSSKKVPILTSDQARALSGIKSGENLLLGVTGSGKTEIYIQKAEEVLKNGGQVLVLVPEISLTPQTILWFEKRINLPVFSYHSELSLAEKSRAWWGVKNNRIKLLVGSRSALLLPFPNLKLLIVDEEQDNSFKQEQSPYYSVRALARFLAQSDPCLSVVYGSATPSLETFARALKGSINLLKLTSRFNTSLPEVIVSESKGGLGLLSAPLKEEIDLIMQNKRQAVLFLDRRGTAGSMLCSNCGQPVLCSRCDLPLVFHRDEERLVCHHCGQKRLPVKNCQYCQSSFFYGRRFGTERLQREIKLFWPKARIIRLDKDTTAKSGPAAPYHRFKAHQADILIGTRMITKGWDIPGVDLVGIIDADLSLFFPEYKAAEETFAMLTQVAGRAGRRRPGKVIIQTRSAAHPVIKAVVKLDYESFAKRELKLRKEEQFPPFVEIVRILIKHKERQRAEEIGKKISQQLAADFNQELLVLGPAACFFEKLNSRFRFQLILKIKRWPRGLAESLRALQRERQITVDRDPKDLL